MIHLTTFHDNRMTRAARLCTESADRNGVAESWIWTPESVSQLPFAREHPEVFSQPANPARAWSYWAFKPAIILQELETHHCINPPSHLIYSDAGVEFINNVNYIIDRMGHEKPQDDVWLFGNNWEHAHWCKRDVVDAIFSKDTLLEYTHWTLPVDWGIFGKQAQASVIFFRVSDYTRSFVAEWLKWCLFEGGRLIDDSPSRAPNHPEFQEHRHDQAILTTLAYREGIKLHYWPAVYNKGGSPEFVYEKLPEYAGDDYPVLFSHHRRRNHE